MVKVFDAMILHGLNKKYKVKAVEETGARSICRNHRDIYPYREFE